MFPFLLIKSPDLKALDNLVYWAVYWIKSLKNEKCYASNMTIAQLIRASAGSVANSLTRLERAGYIERLYFDDGRRRRQEIIPLISFGDESVSSENETLSLGDEAEVSLVDEHNKSIIKKKREKEHMSNGATNLYKQKTYKGRYREPDPAVDELSTYLQIAQNIPALDKTPKMNQIAGRELLDMVMESEAVNEAQAIEKLKLLIDGIVKLKYHDENATSLVYIQQNYQKLRKQADSWEYRIQVAEQYVI